MLRLGITCAQLAVQGQDYRQPLADGMQRILDTDAGAGVAHWDLDNGEISAKSTVTVAGMPPLTKASTAASFSVIPHHPVLSHGDFAHSGSIRVSDVTHLPAFWGQPAWNYIHGIYQAEGYPALLNLGFHSEWAVFGGVQRTRRDLSDDDMELLDTIREPLTSAIAFRSELDRAVRRLQRLRINDEPRPLANGPTNPDPPAVSHPTFSSTAQARHPSWVTTINPPPGPELPAAVAAPLTYREAEVLALVAAGWTNHKVGRVLAITERTVRKHLGNVYEKLGVSGRTSATAWWATQPSNRSQGPATTSGRTVAHSDTGPTRTIVGP